jgi:hypothetical protein
VIFRRRRLQQPAASWPSQGAALWVGLQIGRITGYLAGWPRWACAGIVIAGMGLAIPLFWLGHPGWGVATGFVALVIFWFAVPAATFISDTNSPDDRWEK